MARIDPKKPKSVLAHKAAEALIGRQASITFNGLTFMVKVLETATPYGKRRYRVTPLAGSGEAWVEHITPRP
jgi:hypothetical protein